MLRYSYRMNEPFIGGEDRAVESSHAANVHKRKVAYSNTTHLDPIGRSQDKLPYHIRTELEKRRREQE